MWSELQAALFKSLHEACSKSINTEAVFINTEKDNERCINLLQNIPVGIQHNYSSEYSIGWSTSETPLLIEGETVLSSMSATSSEHIAEMNFQFRKPEKVAQSSKSGN